MLRVPNSPTEMKRREVNTAGHTGSSQKLAVAVMLVLTR